MSPTHHLAHAKWAFTTRRAPRDAVAGVRDAVADAVSGDLALAEVVEIGHHRNLQLAEGRLSELYVGDQVVLCCGDRYAPDQFEASADIAQDAADLVAGGGLIGRVTRRHEAVKTPTRLRPIGLLVAADGDVMNVGSFALPRRPRPAGMAVIGVVGASMNSGKTTATAALAHGLTRAGLRVAALKATGTGAFGDFNMFRDAGAAFVADFTDVGMVSTFRQPMDRVAAGLDTLLGHAAEAGCAVAVVELADGVFQQETAAILAATTLRTAFGGFLLAAPDALSTVGGALVLARLGLRPVAVSGLVSRSPLAAAEAAAETGLEVLSRQALLDPDTAARLLRRATGQTDARAA